MKKIILLIFSLFIFTANAGYCVIDAATGEDIKGYRGDLPDLTERFQRYVPQTARPQFKSVDAFNVSKGYKPVPRDNPTYVNVILKKEKPYLTEESCLSLIGVRKTKRYETIEVEYLDTNFKKHKNTFSGFTAQIIQHEIDHFEGIII